MKRRALMVLAGFCAGLGGFGCRNDKLVNSPPKLEVSLSIDGGIVESFDELLDAGLSFADVPVLTPVTQTLTFSNLGTGGLTVAIELDGGNFSLPGTPLTDVGGGASNLLDVVFEATQKATFTGALLITSNDTNNAIVTIPLTGTGTTAAALDAEPNPLDFGQVGQGQTVTGHLVLSSVGTAPLLIDGLDWGTTDPSITILSSVNLDGGSVVIPIGSSLSLAFAFTPTADTPPVAKATFKISSSDPTQQPAIIQLQGETILKPIAVINCAQTVAQGDTTILDGGGSYDPNTPALTPLTYQWEIASKPENSTLVLLPGQLNNPTLQVTLDAVDNYKFGLQVTNMGGVPSDWTYCNIFAQPTDDLYMEMIWNPSPVTSGASPIDMDLSLLIDGGVVGGDGDCNAYSPDGGFGCVPGSDHLIGPGPEWIGVPIPPDGDYQVECKLTDGKNATSLNTIVTLRIYVYGVLSTQICQRMDTVGETWDAVTISWPSGTVTPIGQTVPCPETN